MARTGLNYLVAAPVPTPPAYGSLPTYGDGFIVGRMIEADVSITLNDNKLFADNREVNNDKTFQSGTITLGVDEFGDGTELSQAQVEALITGGKLVEEGGEKYVDLGEAPKQNTVGLGYIVPGVYPDTGTKYYEAVWYYQVTFGGVGDENAQTKGESISWNTPTVTGNMKPVAGYDAEKNLRRKSRFETEGEAIVWLNIQANIDSTADQLGAANNNELYTLCVKYDIDSVTVDDTPVAISSAASITAETRPAVIAAIVDAESGNAPVDPADPTDDDNDDTP